MHDRPTPWRIVVVAVSATACLSTAACSDDSDAEAPSDTGLVPLAAVLSPEPAAAPSGSVLDVETDLHSTTFDATTHSVVALTDDSTQLMVFDADRLDSAPRALTLPSAAADIVPAGDGTLLLPLRGGLGVVDLGAQGELAVTESTVEGVSDDVSLLSAAVLNDGRIAVGDDRGSIHVLSAAADASSGETDTIDGLTSVDGLASTQYGLAAVDRRQTSITQIDTESDSLGAALRAGTGAAELTTDPYGRILITDAAGSELLVYSSDDLLLRQRFPVGAQPWAVTYDDTTEVVWLSTPADNEVVGYALDTGIPVEVGRFPTVRQPDSIAVDADTGILYVGSAAGGGLQQIPVGDVGR